jgi:hypothetical protein
VARRERRGRERERHQAQLAESVGCDGEHQRGRGRRGREPRPREDARRGQCDQGGGDGDHQRAKLDTRVRDARERALDIRQRTKPGNAASPPGRQEPDEQRHGARRRERDRGRCAGVELGLDRVGEQDGALHRQQRGRQREHMEPELTEPSSGDREHGAPGRPADHEPHPRQHVRQRESGQRERTGSERGSQVDALALQPRMQWLEHGQDPARVPSRLDRREDTCGERRETGCG